LNHINSDRILSLINQEKYTAWVSRNFWMSTVKDYKDTTDSHVLETIHMIGFCFRSYLFCSSGVCGDYWRGLLSPPLALPP